MTGVSRGAYTELGRPMTVADIHREGRTVANQLGKQYVCNKCGAQVIVTKAGSGTIICCGQPMTKTA